MVEYGRQLYASYGLSDRFAYSEDSVEAHGYQVRKREAAYGWFLHWLMNKGDGGPVPEPPTQTLAFDSPELHAFTAADQRAAGPAMVSAAQQVALDLPPHPTRLQLRVVLGPWPSPLPWKPQLSKARLQRLVIPSELGLETPAYLLRPAVRTRRLLVAVDDRGKEAALSDGAIIQAFESGWAVLGVDPRAIGESKTSKNTWLFAVSLMQGENLVWRQAWDILRAIDGIRQAPEFQSLPLALAARGQDASLAAAYLLTQWSQTARAKMSWFMIRDGFLTYHDFIDRPKSLPASYELLTADNYRQKTLDREIPWSLIPFDALDHFDIPQLLKAGGIRGLLVNPIDGDWMPKPMDKARALIGGALTVVCNESPDAEIKSFIEDDR